jgi:hypothetical protein
LNKVFSAWVDVNNNDAGTIYICATSIEEANKIMNENISDSSITSIGTLSEDKTPARYRPSETYLILGDKEDGMLIEIDEKAEEKAQMEAEKEWAEEQLWSTQPENTHLHINGVGHLPDGTIKCFTLSHQERIRFRYTIPLTDSEKLEHEQLSGRYKIDTCDNPREYRTLISEYRDKNNLQHEVSPFFIKEIYCGVSTELFEFETKKQMEDFFTKTLKDGFEGMGEAELSEAFEEGAFHFITGYSLITSKVSDAPLFTSDCTLDEAHANHVTP